MLDKMKTTSLEESNRPTPAAGSSIDAHTSPVVETREDDQGAGVAVGSSVSVLASEREAGDKTDDKVLVERNGKFVLLSSEELQAEAEAEAEVTSV